MFWLSREYARVFYSYKYNAKVGKKCENVNEKYAKCLQLCVLQEIRGAECHQIEEIFHKMLLTNENFT